MGGARIFCGGTVSVTSRFAGDTPAATESNRTFSTEPTHLINKKSVRQALAGGWQGATKEEDSPWRERWKLFGIHRRSQNRKRFVSFFRTRRLRSCGNQISATLCP